MAWNFCAHHVYIVEARAEAQGPKAEQGLLRDHAPWGVKDIMRDV